MTTHELLGGTTDAAEHDAEEASPSTASPLPAGDALNLTQGVPELAQEPMTELELDAIVTAIWSDLTEDPYRVGDLLADAIGFIGRYAVDPSIDPYDAARAAGLLRRMEQRALWGPTVPHPDVRIIWAETC